MLCFKDKTFCSSKTHKPECDRQWTPELQKEAEEWARQSGLSNVPVSFAPLCGEEDTSHITILAFRNKIKKER
jgi:hypothetical protein